MFSFPCEAPLGGRPARGKCERLTDLPVPLRLPPPLVKVDFEEVRGEPGPDGDGFNTAALPRSRMTGLRDRTLDFRRICARPNSQTLFACVQIQAKASENDKISFVTCSLPVPLLSYAPTTVDGTEVDPESGLDRISVHTSRDFKTRQESDFN